MLFEHLFYDEFIAVIFHKKYLICFSTGHSIIFNCYDPKEVHWLHSHGPSR